MSDLIARLRFLAEECAGTEAGDGLAAAADALHALRPDKPTDTEQAALLVERIGIVNRVLAQTPIDPTGLSDLTARTIIGALFDAAPELTTEWAVQERTDLDGPWGKVDDGRGWSNRRGEPYSEDEARASAVKQINGADPGLWRRVVIRRVEGWRPERSTSLK